MFKKRLFVVGENLIANCTTTKAKPPPTITWLINGKKVRDKSFYLIPAGVTECKIRVTFCKAAGSSYYILTEEMLENFN